MSQYSSDKLIVAGVASPGVVKLSGHVRDKGWDVQNAKGQDGGTTTRTGQNVGKFSAEFYLVDDPSEGNDFDEWPAFQRLLESSVTGNEPVALDVVHPDLQRQGFTAAVLESMGEMVEDGRGGAHIKVSFLEYCPPKPKAASAPSKAKQAQQEVKDLADNTPLIPYDPSEHDGDAEKQNAIDEGAAL